MLGSSGKGRQSCGVRAYPFMLTMDHVFTGVHGLGCQCVGPTLLRLIPSRLRACSPFAVHRTLGGTVTRRSCSCRKVVGIVRRRSHLVFSGMNNFVPSGVRGMLRGSTPRRQCEGPFLMNTVMRLGVISAVNDNVHEVFGLRGRHFFPVPSCSFSSGGIGLAVMDGILSVSCTCVLTGSRSLGLVRVRLLDEVRVREGLASCRVTCLHGEGLIRNHGGTLCVTGTITDGVNGGTSCAGGGKLSSGCCGSLLFGFVGRREGIDHGSISSLLLAGLPSTLARGRGVAGVKRLLSTLGGLKFVQLNGGGV